MSLNLSDTLGFFSDGGNGVWKCKNGQTVQGGILSFYRSFGMRALFGLSYLGLPVSAELAPVAGYAGRVQVFERGAVAFDPDRKFDQPPGVPASFDPSYLVHVDSGPANAVLAKAAVAAAVAAANTQVASLQASLASAQADLVTANHNLLVAQNQVAADAVAISSAQSAQKVAEDKLALTVTALDAAAQKVADLTSQVAALEAAPPKADALGDALRALIAEAKSEGVL